LHAKRQRAVKKYWRKTEQSTDSSRALMWVSPRQYAPPHTPRTRV